MGRSPSDDGGEDDTGGAAEKDEPLEVLGRSRVNVLVSCSGVFRDLFINQMKRWQPRPTSLSTRTSSASTPSSRPQSSISWYMRPLARVDGIV